MTIPLNLTMSAYIMDLGSSNAYRCAVVDGSLNRTSCSLAVSQNTFYNPSGAFFTVRFAYVIELGARTRQFDDNYGAALSECSLTASNGIYSCYKSGYHEKNGLKRPIGITLSRGYAYVAQAA